MAVSSLSDLFLIGIDILKTKLDSATKTIFAQLGSVTEEYPSGHDENEWWQHVGFASRPAIPTPKHKAAQCVAIRHSERDVVIASRDTRSQTIYGSLGEGETCVYAAGADGNSQGRVLLKDNGSVNLYTREGNSPTGGGIAIMMSAEEDSISIVNSKGYGIIINADGVKLTANNSGLTLDSGGKIKLVGKGQTQVDGSTVLLGSIAVPVANSALKGPSGALGTASLKVLVE